jgi:hypothetical protein
MLGLNLGRYVIARFNIVCGRNVIIFYRGTYINKKKEIESWGFWVY